MENAPEHNLIVDRDRRILDVNYTSLWQREHTLGKRLDDFVEGENLQRMHEAVARAFDTGKHVAYRAELRGPNDPELHYYRNDVIPLGGLPPEFLLIRALDVTEQVHTRQAKEESEARYLSLTEHLPDFVVILDRERRIEWLNRVAPGLRLEDILGTRVDDLISPDVRAQSVAAIEEAFTTGVPTRYLGRTDSVDDSPRWYLNRAVPMRDRDAVERVLLLTTDVTDQKRTELALSASERRLEQALDAAEVGLWEWTPSRNVVLASELWARAAGLPATSAEIPLETFYASIHPDDLLRVRRTLERATSADSASFELEYRVRRDEHDEGRWLLHRGRFVASEDPSVPPCVLGTQLDMTGHRDAERERMSLQEQLQRAQRLESIGQLAGGVAHDFNNLLLVVLSQTELARRAVERGKDPAGPLAEVEAASMRAAELTKKLLAFSRQQGLSTRTVHLGEQIERLLEMVRRLIPENIRVTHVRHGQDDTAAVDTGQIEQVLLNLCLNARDAMPDGGQVVIETGCVELSAEDLRDQPTLAPGPYVRVRVRDSGMGIPADVQTRMFEPFFSTKPAGRGTGLGLSVSDGIIRQHGGLIRVDSALGRGTTFDVLLPHSDTPNTTRPAAPSPRPEPGTETILVAEDEDMVRGLVAQILTEAGYRVITACDGLEAVEKFEAMAGEISLVLLDAVMPNLDGRGAYERIVALDPQARFLVSSGYSDQQMPETLLARENLEMLHKPYAPDDLLRAVRKVLDLCT